MPWRTKGHHDTEKEWLHSRLARLRVFRANVTDPQALEALDKMRDDTEAPLQELGWGSP